MEDHLALLSLVGPSRPRLVVSQNAWTSEAEYDVEDSRKCGVARRKERVKLMIEQ